MAMSDYTKIPKWVKVKVWERDNMRCVVCGQVCDISNACSHIVRRSQGGMGIPENIVVHCYYCHQRYDAYDEYTRNRTLDYIKIRYPGWQESEVTFHRYGKDGLKSEY